MSYNSYPEFAAGLVQAWPEAQTADDTLKSYYEWYKLARAQNRIVLGREHDLNQFVAAYGRAGTGGAMLIGVKSWDIIVNDCWMMGGINAQIPFFLKTVLDYNAVYNTAQKANADPTRALFVTTREVAGLNLFGYSMTDPAAPDGQKFDCVQPSLAANATFKAYRQHTQAVALAARS